MNPTFTRVALYVRDMPKVAAFYQKHFGYELRTQEPGLWELKPAGKGIEIVLLQASKGNRSGQSNVKFIFDVPDVAQQKKLAARRGLKFGPIHDGGGYSYSNARDPAGNLIQISSRKFRKR